VTVFLSALRLALTTLTVLPIKPGRIDRRVGGTAMVLAPAVGLALGGVISGVAWTLDRARFAPLPIAAVLVVLLVLLTRALHLDGLADTADALGSYRIRERALAIMRSPEVGPMGVAAIGLVLLVDVAALTTLVADQEWLAVAAGIALGRAAITMCCRRGVPSARSDGLAVLVADSVPAAIPFIWVGILAIGATVAADRRWPGLLAAFLVAAATMAVIRHVVHRLGGITGDVLGAACELGTAIALLVLSAG
jgi:adenosylcobinamide-GDP ribazoletransferase